MKSIFYFEVICRRASHRQIKEIRKTVLQCKTVCILRGWRFPYASAVFFRTHRIVASCSTLPYSVFPEICRLTTVIRTATMTSIGSSTRRLSEHRHTRTARITKMDTARTVSTEIFTSCAGAHSKQARAENAAVTVVGRVASVWGVRVVASRSISLCLTFFGMLILYTISPAFSTVI